MKFTFSRFLEETFFQPGRASAIDLPLQWVKPVVAMALIIMLKASRMMEIIWEFLFRWNFVIPSSSTPMPFSPFQREVASLLGVTVFSSKNLVS